MGIALSDRAKGISPSATLAIDAKAKAMKAEGIDVISFGAGEPDFETPAHIKDRAIAAIRENFTKYTISSGILPLREAIVEKLSRENGLNYPADQVVVTVGGKHALYALCQVLLNPGDEVIIPSPYWVSYVEQVRLAGGVPVVAPTRSEESFMLTAADLRKSLTPRTKALMLNTPTNPTGTVYTRERLEELGEVVLERGLVVVADEIYERLTYDDVEHVSIASLSPELKALSIIVNGVSKSYAMTGWRIGYIAADARNVIKAVADHQSHSTSNPTSIAQAAAVAALGGDQAPVEKMRGEFLARRDLMVARLRRIPGVRCGVPKGAFYTFPDVSALYGRRFVRQDGVEKLVTNSTDLAQVLLEEGKVAAVPGIAFGDDKCLRLSYATSMDNILVGMERLEAVLKGLQ